MTLCPPRYGLTCPPLPRDALALAGRAQDCIDSLEDITAALKRIEGGEVVLEAVQTRLRQVADG